MNKAITLITGTRKGIGRYLSEYYVKQGHLVIGCSREPSTYQNENYEHFILDVNDEHAIQHMLQTIRSKYGHLDNLINNAGIASMNHALLTPSDTARNIFNTNVISIFVMIREAAKLMRQSKSPRIINFTTVAVPLNLAGEALYAASKSAVETLTRVLAKELAEYQITINAIGPTPIQTDLIKGVSKEKINELIQKQAIKRLGEFQDVSNVIDFFIRKESAFITGQTLYLGGIT